MVKCCICGPVRDCGPFLNQVISNMETIGRQVFENDYVIYLVYDPSKDDSLAILRQRALENPKILLNLERREMSPFRTHRIAAARNACLQFVRNQEIPYFLMMDMDNVNCKNVNVQPLQNAMKPEQMEKWDALSFQSMPKYYDIWGLSIVPFCFSYNHFDNNFAFHGKIADFVQEKLSHVVPNEYLPCISSFNGIALYKTKKFDNCFYDGRVRQDLFSKEMIQLHAVAQQSRPNRNGSLLKYKNYNKNHIMGFYEDCEHRSFHRMGTLYNHARIMISPEAVFV